MNLPLQGEIIVHTKCTQIGYIIRCDLLTVSLWTTAPMKDRLSIPSTQARTPKHKKKKKNYLQQCKHNIHTSWTQTRGIQATLVFIPYPSSFPILPCSIISSKMQAFSLLPKLDSFPRNINKTTSEAKDFFFYPNWSFMFLRQIKHWKFSHGFNRWREEYNEKLCVGTWLFKKNNPFKLTTSYAEFGYGSTMLTLFWTIKGSNKWNLWLGGQGTKQSSFTNQPHPLQQTHFLNISLQKCRKNNH